MKDYVQKLANDIEAKLDMSRSDIKDMPKSEFRSLLKNAYFNRKRYTKRQSEPTDRQMDVLNLYYGKEVSITRYKKTYNIGNKYYFNRKKDKRKSYPKYVRYNKKGRLIDAETGKFIKSKK